MKSNLLDKWSAFRDTPQAKKLKRFLQRGIVLGIIGLIAYQLTGIGWREVFQSLPTNPLFYLIFAVLYVSLPFAEIFIYRQVWTFRPWEGFKAFVSKNIYNQEVVGYSGEFYLFLWARKRMPDTDKELFKHIRDNSILSAITSNLVAVLLLVVLLYTKTIELEGIIDDVNLYYVLGGVILFIGAVIFAIQFRSYIFSLPVKKTIVVFLIYLFRFIFDHLGMVFMWAAAISGVSWSVWFTFLAILVVVNRIPFMPSKDLVFMWVGIEYARMMDVTLASFAAMLLVYSAMKKLLNVFVLSLLSVTTEQDDEKETSVEQKE
ncbi:hypothetical protein QLX67_12285 [Balneolaceae bacterium ANBcel3]|nr:hypothetical protein [Balneolaceae bacterium ANBcel3]